MADDVAETPTQAWVRKLVFKITTHIQHTETGHLPDSLRKKVADFMTDLNTQYLARRILSQPTSGTNEGGSPPLEAPGSDVTRSVNSNEGNHDHPSHPKPSRKRKSGRQSTLQGDWSTPPPVLADRTKKRQRSCKATNSHRDELALPHISRLPLTQRSGEATNSHRDELALPHISRLPLTPYCHPNALNLARDSFYREVGAMSVKVKHDNKEEIVEFSQEEAKDLTLLLIDRTTSIDSRKHLYTFVQEYNQLREGEGAVVRAEDLAEGSDTPDVVRQFYSTFSRNERSRRKVPEIVQYVKETVQDIELLETYNEICSQAKARDDNLLQFLQNKGYKTSKGIGWATVIINFLSDELKMEDRNILTNKFASTRTAHDLTQIFGKSIVLLLPQVFMNKIQQFRVQRMAAVFPILKKNLPQLQVVCDFVHDRWYTPYIDGAEKLLPVPDPDANMDTSHNSYLEMIEVEADTEDN